MLNFFYLSSVVAIVIYAIYFRYASRKIDRKYREKNDGSNKARNLKAYICMIKSVIIAVCIVWLLSFVLPLIIWNTSKKDFGISDRIDEQEQLLTLSQINSKAYIGKKVEKNIEYYVVNLKNSSGNTELLKIASSSVEVVRVGKGQTPVYQKISQYKIKKLNQNNIICDSVNDMYANIYLDTSKAQYVGHTEKLLIPADSQIIDYK